MRAAVDPGSAAAARPGRRRRAEQVVARVVAQLVVDPLEPVDVAHDDARLVAGLERRLRLGVRDAAVGQAGQRVVGDEVAHLRLQVDARDGAGDQRGEHLGARDVVDPERRTRPAADGVQLTPHGAVDHHGRRQRGRGVELAQRVDLDRVTRVGVVRDGRLVVHGAGVRDPAGAVADEGAQRGPVVGAVGGTHHPDRAGSDGRRLDHDGAARVLVDAAERDVPRRRAPRGPVEVATCATSSMDRQRSRRCAARASARTPTTPAADLLSARAPGRPNCDASRRPSSTLDPSWSDADG